MQPLILTLKLDAIAAQILDQLRERHFPPERNFLSAHVTLFHALPGEQEGAIRGALRLLSAQTPTFSLCFPQPFFMGRGVAIAISSPDLLALHQDLTQLWQANLTPQDRQGFRPHVTIQNKVSAQEARKLFGQLSRTWEPLSATGEGLLLWSYQGGPWDLIEEFPFTA